MSKKAVSLPINMIIIMIIAVITLLVVIAFFLPQWFAQTNSIGVEQAFSKGCTMLQGIYKCSSDSVSEVKISDFDADNDPSTEGDNTLLDVCKKKFNDPGVTAKQCAQACNCG